MENNDETGRPQSSHDGVKHLRQKACHVKHVCTFAVLIVASMC